MILEESLKALSVVAKGGGNIVSHRPVFSTDNKNLFVISSSTLYVYSTESGLCIGKFQTPSAAPIVNIKALASPPDILMVFTSSGEILEVNISTYTINLVRQMNLAPANWIPISHFTNFLWPSSTSKIERFFALGYPAEATKPILYAVTTDTLFIDKVCWSVEPNLHSFACGQNGRLLAAIQEDSLFVKDFKTKAVKWHKAGTRKFTCVAVHPEDWICATGDDSGRIVVWMNFMEKTSPAKTVFHWHTLPVIDICFSVDGTQLLSGGGECTMVKWDINNTHNKRTLPRMGLPIRHISISSANAFTAISHADNSIQLVNPLNEIVKTIQNITQCYIPECSEDVNASATSLGGSLVYQAGLHIDPNNQSVVMNGKPGHLQCYSFRDDKHLYSLDITQQNFITAERNRPIPNADVCHVAFSKHGTWLATAESRVDEAKFTELRLKFWKFERNTQVFALNTSIDWPHENELKSLKIQPISEEDPTLIAATSGDASFKTWGIVNDPSIHAKTEWWNCENVGSYRSLPAGPLSFSHDGSMLAAAFGKVLTLWTSDSHQLKLSLCHKSLPEEIRLVEFGTHLNSHLVISCTPLHLIVWDVISSSLLWVVSFQAECICVDPFSNLIAAFSTKHHLYFFRLDKPQPIAIHKNVSSSRIISSIFVSNLPQFERSGLKSTLLFINSSQELSSLQLGKDEAEIGSDLRVNSEGKAHLTPFAQMVAEKTVIEVDRSGRDSRHLGGIIGLPGNQVLREIMDASPHTMPSVSYFCTQLLQSLSIRRNPSDKLEDIEEAMKSTRPKLRKKKPLKYKTNVKDEEDDELSDINEPNQFESKSATTVGTDERNSDLNIDLQLVANEDISWIKSIYSSS